MTRPRPSDALLDQFRRHRAQLQPFQTLYPYAMGRVEGALRDTTLKPAARIGEALSAIAALDIVNDEPIPTRKDTE